MITGAVCGSLKPFSIGFMLKTIRIRHSPSPHAPHTHTDSHACTHARTHARTRTHTFMCVQKEGSLPVPWSALHYNIEASSLKALRIYQQAGKVYTLPRENPQFSRTAVRCLTCRGTCTTAAPTPVTTAARAKSGQTA